MSTTGYILIGLIVGGVTGAGASYILIFPGMVETKVGDFNQQFNALENSITNLNNDVSTLQSQVSTLQDLSTTVNALSSKVDRLSDDLISFESTLNSIQNEVEQTKILAEKTNAYEILKKEAAKPGGFIAGLLVDELFDELRGSESKIITWIAIVGHTIVKDAISTVINSQIPALVWNNYDASKAGTNLYDVYIVTYFPIEIDTGLPIVGTINIARINLVLKGRVNISSETVSSIDVWNIMLT